MKKLLNTCIIVLGFTALYSCEKEINPQDINSNESRHYTITVDFAQTRVDLDEDLYASWVEGDRIAVETEESGFVPFKLIDGVGTRSGVFEFDGEGDVTPKDGGYIVYPYDDYAPGTYTFPAVLNYGSSNIESYPNGVSSDGTKFYSFVPMVGKINYNASTKELNSGLRYASGAIKIKYSKLSQDAKGLEITMDQNIAGDATLTEKGGLKITANGSNTLTVKFNDESKGFPNGISFIVPIPEVETTYKSISIRVTAKNKATVPGTAKSITTDFRVLAGHVVPFAELEQITPPYIFTEYTGSSLSEGEYILVYDPEDGENVYINGDDGVRESLLGTLDPGWGAVQEGKTVVLDYADYLTGAWIISRSNGTWRVKNEKAAANGETWTCSATKQNNGYWDVRVTVQGGKQPGSDYQATHYYQYKERDIVIGYEENSWGLPDYSKPINLDWDEAIDGVKVYEYGLFLRNTGDPNIKLYKLKED